MNTVHPTAVRTPMGDDPGLRAVLGAHEHLSRSFGNMLPTGKIDASDVSDAVLWLPRPTRRGGSTGASDPGGSTPCASQVWSSPPRTAPDLRTTAHRRRQRRSLAV